MIPASQDAALARFVAETGLAKAAVVRDALERHLTELGLLAPTLVPERRVLTRGRGLAAHRTRKDT